MTAGMHDGLTAALCRVAAEVAAGLESRRADDAARAARHAGVCEWDTGSATGCRPACDAPAAVVVTYDGYRGPYVTRLCARHARALPARVWPSAVTSTAPLPGPGANRPCADCGATVTLELTGTWRAPFYAPCPSTGDTRHRVTS